MGGAGQATSHLPASRGGRPSLAGFRTPRPPTRRGGYWAARSLQSPRLLGEGGRGRGLRWVRGPERKAGRRGRAGRI